MNAHPKLISPLTTISLFVVFTLISSSICFGNDRNPALKTRSSVLYAKKPNNYRRDEDYLYRTYISDLDAGLVRDYEDRFNYHDSVVNYHRTSWNHEYFAIGTMNYLGKGTRVDTVRNQMANRVLRSRIDHSVRVYLRSMSYVKQVQRAAQALDNIKHVSISSNSKDREAWKLNFGYDVFNDSSKLEYAKGQLSAGLYHPHLMGSLTGSLPRTENVLSIRVRAPLGEGLPSASVQYTMGNGSLSSGLHKRLSQSVSTSLVNTRPITNESTVRDSYRVLFNYRF